MLFRLLLLLFTASLTLGVSAAPKITWLQTDWPPHQIVSGPFQGQGTFDLLQQQLIAALPQFRHQSRLVSLARVEQLFLQQQPGICAVGTLYSAQRAASRLFSTPMAVGPALAVVHLATHPGMTQAGADALEINPLAQHAGLVGAYQPNRYYPPVVMQAIQQPSSNLTSQTFTSELNAAQLLQTGRVDYVIEYPERMQYYNSLLSQPVALQHSAIVGADIASVSYVTCTAGKAGEQAIAAIDKALRQLWRSADYQTAMRRWLDDAAWQRLSPQLEQIRLDYQAAAAR